MKLPFSDLLSTSGDSDGGLVDTLIKFLSPLLVLVTLAGLYAWQIDAVRMKGIDYLDVLGNRAAVNALSDPSATVAEQACAAIIDQKLIFQYPSIVSTLAQRPEIALSCLEDSLGAKPARYGELMPHDWIVAQRLGYIWHERLMKAQDQGEMSCEITDHIDKAFSLMESSSEDLIFDCAVSARSAQTRRCCQQSFDEDHLAELLDNPQWFELNYATHRLPEHASQSFGFSLPEADDKSEEDSTDHSEEADSTAPDEDDAESPSDGDIARAELQDWVVGQGCRVLHTEEDGRTTISVFEPVFDTTECRGGRQTPQGYYEKSSWLNLCNEHYQYQREQGRAPAEAICGALAQGTMGEAVRAAQIEVNVATRVRVPGAGDSLMIAPPRAAFTAKSHELGGRQASTQRMSAASPVLRGFFSRLIPGM